MSSLVDNIVAATGASRCLVSVLVALSFPLRASLTTFLQTYRAILLAEKAKLVGKTAQADVIAQQLGIIVAAGRAALAPFNTILGAIPFAQLSKCAGATEDLQHVVDNTPTAIPSSFITQAANIDGFDIFTGVTDYKSMRNKLDELAFRLQRALTVSDKASKLSTSIDRSLSVIDTYLAIFSRMQ